MAIHLKSVIAAFALLLAGCAGQPNPVAKVPPGALTLAEALADPAAHVGRTLRWGGTLVSVRNRRNDSMLEILARPLSASGVPDIEAPSPGRFRAVVAGFVDPAAHPAGTRVTVVGSLIGSEQGRIGEYEYRYPLVRAERWHDWGVYREPEPVYDPFFCCSPWDPWYGGYGWWGPRYP